MAGIPNMGLNFPKSGCGNNNLPGRLLQYKINQGAMEIYIFG